MSTLTKILTNKEVNCKSIWFMRQAGRHLPEFREVRSRNKDFIKLCLNSKLSSELTLQPIKRYNLDAAIIFSDILLIPYALGQNVKFIKNEGPSLSKFEKEKFFKIDKNNFLNNLKPVYDSIKLTRTNLNKDKSLISFIGAPWTLLVYMFDLKVNKVKIDNVKYNQSINQIRNIINNLIEFLCLHIEKQIEAGADVVQIFDSWAGLIPKENLDEFCYKPNSKLVDFCKERKIPVICFPKGLKKNYLDFNKSVKPDGLSLDYELDVNWVKANLTDVVLQGGMDPKFLLKDEDDIFNEAKKYLDTFKNVPYIFNLGHGIIPETSPDKLKKLVNFVREYE